MNIYLSNIALTNMIIFVQFSYFSRKLTFLKEKLIGFNPKTRSERWTTYSKMIQLDTVAQQSLFSYRNRFIFCHPKSGLRYAGPA